MGARRRSGHWPRAATCRAWPAHDIEWHHDAVDGHAAERILDRVPDWKSDTDRVTAPDVRLMARYGRRERAWRGVDFDLERLLALSLTA